MPSTSELFGFVESAAKKAWRALRDGRLRPAPREWLYQLNELTALARLAEDCAPARFSATLEAALA